MSRGTKFNGGKPRMSLVPSGALIEVAKTYTYGEIKYDAHNWRKGIPFSELVDSSLRHIHAFLGGETLDPESNLHHLAHATTGLLNTLELMRDCRTDLDDRWECSITGFGDDFERVMNEPPIKLKEATNDED